MKLLQDDKGQVLIIALVLLLFGALIIAPVLAYVGTGLKVGKDVHEERMAELYAADAGVEYGLWHLQDIERLKQLVEDFTGGELLPEDWKPADYTWPVDGIPCNPGEDINGKAVTGTVGYLPDDKAFRITSTALSEDGSSTRIDAYASGLNFYDMLQNAITSTTLVTILGEKGEVRGTIVEDYPVEHWPLADVLSEFYFNQVTDVPPEDGATIELTDTDNFIGPLSVDGNLTIKSTGNDVTLTLLDTIYVTGTLAIGKTNKDFTLNLNGQTIFVGSNEPYPSGAVIIGGRTTITGSGCIIAVGGINFQPKIDQGSPDDFLFVMSIDDTTFAHPIGNFNGSFAGNVEVQLQPTNDIIWNDPYDNDLNFPMGGYVDGKLIFEIEAWEIETSTP